LRLVLIPSCKISKEPGDVSLLNLPSSDPDEKAADTVPAVDGVLAATACEENAVEGRYVVVTSPVFCY